MLCILVAQQRTMIWKKGYLQDSMRDLEKGWKAINVMLTVQFTEIQATFGRNSTVLELKFEVIKCTRVWSIMFLDLQ
jgi:hypothetical protein